tara:strand:- start:1055 stop:2344 length:1290 start_codon:yes stop_codon:yes gene_type:complete
MKFSTVFKLEENLNLDRKTFVILRWIAIIGQFIAITFVYFFLKLEFPILVSYSIVLLGLSTNLYLQFKVKSILLRDFHASIFLIYDLIQLSFLLYITGGISNPFSILLIIPAIVSSTFLSVGTTFILGILTVFFLFILTIFHFPLPGIHENAFTFPKYYLIGFFFSIIIGLIFLCYFGNRFAAESKKRSEALNKLQQLIAKEYELESLGGQAAAAAHSLGTPLATIAVIAKEMKKESGENSKNSKDFDLLISQTKRCSEILKKISQKELLEDKFINETSLENILQEIKSSFDETSDKTLTLISKKNNNNVKIKRPTEIIYGLRNFIGNAVKFSNEKVDIEIKSDNKKITIIIDDDGPGFPEDIIELIGEPYIKSKTKYSELKSGLGLGTFLGKTLLEKQKAQLNFSNNGKLKGAKVTVSWNIEDVEVIS